MFQCFFLKLVGPLQYACSVLSVCLFVFNSVRFPSLFGDCFCPDRPDVFLRRTLLLDQGVVRTPYLLLFPLSLSPWKASRFSPDHQHNLSYASAAHHPWSFYYVFGFLCFIISLSLHFIVFCHHLCFLLLWLLALVLKQPHLFESYWSYQTVSVQKTKQKYLCLVKVHFQMSDLPRGTVVLPLSYTIFHRLRTGVFFTCLWVWWILMCWVFKIHTETRKLYSNSVCQQTESKGPLPTFSVLGC